MVILRNDLVSFSGNVGAEVLSTHQVVLLMGLAARKAIRGRISEGKITVGTRIDLKHFAAGPAGSKVSAAARLKTIEGRRFF